MNLNRTIARLRKEKGMSQAELAKSSDLSTTYISLVEGGKKRPSLDSLVRISDALGVPFPILSFLSLDEDDIRPEKRAAFKLVGPAVNAMIEEFFLKELT